MTSKQVQKTGPGQSYQSQGDMHITHGVDLAVALEVIEAKFQVILNESSQVAIAVATERIDQFKETFFGRFNSAPLLEAFSDPDFAYSILEAQRSAVRSGSDDDIEMIIEILAQRAIAGATPRIKSVTRRALEVVGLIADDALAGLTVLWWLTSMRIAGDTLAIFVYGTDTLLEPFVPMLPTHPRWLDDLDLNDCISLGTRGLGGLKGIPEIVADQNPLFVSAGLPGDPEDARAKLATAEPLLGDLLIQHSLDSERWLIPGFDVDSAVLFARARVGTELSVAAELAVRDVAAACLAGGRLPMSGQLLLEQLQSRSSLSQILEWWKNFPPVQVTPLGAALAVSNMRRTAPYVVMPDYAEII